MGDLDGENCLNPRTDWLDCGLKKAVRLVPVGEPEDQEVQGGLSFDLKDVKGKVQNILKFVPVQGDEKTYENAQHDLIIRQQASLSCTRKMKWKKQRKRSMQSSPRQRQRR